jgi:hypothetical protein
LVTAPQAGIEHCDILDRERLRIELDSPAGFFVRFQHLGIPLSEAEQASFLARYGDRIQQVVTVGLSDNRADPSKSRAGGPAYRALPKVSGGSWNVELYLAYARARTGARVTPERS